MSDDGIRKAADELRRLLDWEATLLANPEGITNEDCNRYDYESACLLSAHGHELLAMCEAVLAAPVVELDCDGDEVALIAEGSWLENAIKSARIYDMDGQRVRLLPEPPK